MDPAFREEFLKLKGYDPLPWLVTLGHPITGDPKKPRVRILGSEELTNRFERDCRDVIATLYHNNGCKPAAVAMGAQTCFSSPASTTHPAPSRSPPS